MKTAISANLVRSVSNSVLGRMGTLGTFSPGVYSPPYLLFSIFDFDFN